MNSRTLIAGALTASLLAGCAQTERETGDILRLPPCTGTAGVFASQLDTLPSTYHGIVAGVIDSHMRQLESTTTTPFQCTARTYREMLRPTPALRSLADRLPEWGPSRAATLSEADMASVLLEYLRTYECALLERGQFLKLFVLQERAEREERPDGTTVQFMDRGDLTREEARQEALILRELNVSRPALERTLSVIGGFDRMRPLTVEIECLKRASLDLRNGLGLTAEAASCMPKIWDARGSLRDLPEDEDE